MRTMIRAFVAFVALSTLALTAPAQSQVTDRERALEYFRLSAIEYDAGHFAEAVSLLRQAIRLQDDPVLHYNLARALEAEGDLGAAVESYEHYLEMDDDPTARAGVEGRLRALRRQLEEREQLERERDEARAAARAAAEREAVAREAARAASSETESSPADPTPVDDEPDDAGGGSVAPWLILGSGVVVAGGGMVFALLGQKRHDDAVDHPTHRVAARLEDESSTFATLANVFFIAGGVIAAGGLLWGLLTLGGDDAEESTVLRLGPGGFELRGVF